MLNEDMSVLLKRLKRTSEAISYLNKINTNKNSIDEIKTEIKILGWQGILNKYHPDINLDTDSYQLFQLYKYFYKLIEKYGDL